ncbi:MAG: hypothetical protein DMG33_14150 [Acidobacteria bacterium]|nr:MAG: hypothetical protein DMG33_14150 [Acidobacteriota bacterium]
MIYLNPPFPIINGVSLMPDHQDPTWFYYLPLAPKLTVLPDSATGQGVPQIQLIKFRGTAGSGGFLNFDCNLGIDSKALDDVADELRSMLHLREKPKLGPLPVVDGTVRLLLFGASTPPPPEPGSRPSSAGGSSGSSGSSSSAAAVAVAGPKFVLRIDQSAHPALYGENQAVFSVSLDAAGVTTLEQALQGEMSPIGIVYALDYLALRPAYNVHLHIDWDRVQKALDEQFSASVLCFSSQIDTAVDKLVESRAIQLDVDTFVPEGEDTTSIISSRDRAVQEVRDMITNAFFQSSIDPATPRQDGWDRAAGFAERASTMAATGGMAGLASFSHKKTDYTRIDKKMLDVNMRERTTVKRTIYPQAHLAGLFQVLRDQHLDLSRFVIPVNLDDPWFQRRQVNVISRANFDEDSVTSLNVQLRYGNDGKSVLLEPSRPTDKVDWASNISAGAVQRDVNYQYTVSFKSIDGTQRPPSLDSPQLLTQADNLEIDPRRLYSLVHIPITTISFPWQKYSTVEVQVRYADPANHLHEQQTFLLNSDKGSQDWKIFILDPQLTSFECKLIFRGADGHDLEKPWVTTDQQQVIIRDPFPMKRSVDVVAAVPWDKVQNVFVDLFYDDPANNISQQSSVTFSKTDPAPKSFTVELRDPNQRRVAYEITILFADGRMTQIPRSYTLDARIFVRSDMRGHKIVSIRPEAADFAALKIKQVIVNAKYEDLGNGLSFGNQSIFTKPENSGSFEFDYVDPNQAKYSYQASVQFINGMSRDTDWQMTDAADLVVPVT